MRNQKNNSKKEKELQKLRAENKKLREIVSKESKTKESEINYLRRDRNPLIKIEKRNNVSYLIARKPNGKIISYKKYNKKEYENDILYFKQERTFKRRTAETSYGKKYTFKSGKTLRYRKYDVNTEKGKGVKTESRYESYIIYIEGYYKDKTGIHKITRSSDEHNITYPKSRAYDEANSRFLADIAYILTANYDENEGQRLMENDRIVITDYYISYR